MLVCSAVFGFTFGSLDPLSPKIVTELVGDENLTVGYGILLAAINGIGSMCGAPIAGL